jgi:hypothetical protein
VIWGIRSGFIYGPEPPGACRHQSGKLRSGSKGETLTTPRKSVASGMAVALATPSTWVVRLLVDRTVTGIVSVGALPGLVGDDLAKGFTRHLGRDVRFESLDPEEFGRLLAPMIGEPGARPVVASTSGGRASRTR